MWKGELLHIHIAEAASYEMEELERAELVAGKGNRWRPVFYRERYVFAKTRRS